MILKHGTVFHVLLDTIVFRVRISLYICLYKFQIDVVLYDRQQKLPAIVYLKLDRGVLGVSVVVVDRRAALRE